MLLGPTSSVVVFVGFSVDLVVVLMVVWGGVVSEALSGWGKGLAAVMRKI